MYPLAKYLLVAWAILLLMIAGLMVFVALEVYGGTWWQPTAVILTVVLIVFIIVIGRWGSKE